MRIQYKPILDDLNKIINDPLLKTDKSTKKPFVWNTKTQKIIEFKGGIKGTISAIFYTLIHKHAVLGNKYQEIQRNNLTNDIRNLSELDLNELKSEELQQLTSELQQLTSTLSKVDTQKGILKKADLDILNAFVENVYNKTTENPPKGITLTNAFTSLKDKKLGELPQYLNDLNKVAKNYHNSIVEGSLNIPQICKESIASLNLIIPNEIDAIINSSKTEDQKERELTKLLQDCQNIKNSSYPDIPYIKNLNIDHFLQILVKKTNNMLENKEMLIRKEFLVKSNPTFADTVEHIHSFEDFVSQMPRYFKSKLNSDDKNFDKALTWVTHLEFTNSSSLRSQLLHRQQTVESLVDIVPPNSRQATKLSELLNKSQTALDLLNKFNKKDISFEKSGTIDDIVKSLKDSIIEHKAIVEPEKFESEINNRLQLLRGELQPELIFSLRNDIAKLNEDKRKIFEAKITENIKACLTSGYQNVNNADEVQDTIEKVEALLAQETLGPILDSVKEYQAHLKSAQRLLEEFNKVKTPLTDESRINLSVAIDENTEVFERFPKLNTQFKTKLKELKPNFLINKTARYDSLVPARRILKEAKLAQKQALTELYDIGDNPKALRKSEAAEAANKAVAEAQINLKFLKGQQYLVAKKILEDVS